MKRIGIAVAVLAALAGCATHSGVMEREDGAYTISAMAAPARGGAVGARQFAFEQAQEHCKKESKRAVLIERPEDFQATGQVSYVSGNANYQRASVSGGSAPAIGPGQSSISFRCK